MVFSLAGSVEYGATRVILEMADSAEETNQQCRGCADKLLARTSYACVLPTKCLLSASDEEGGGGIRENTSAFSFLSFRKCFEA